MISKYQFQEWLKKSNLESAYSIQHLLNNYHLYNGCGRKGRIKIPPFILFVFIGHICAVHDIEWSLASSHQELINANDRMRRNFKSEIEIESMWFGTYILRIGIATLIMFLIDSVGTEAEVERKGFT